MAVEVTELEGEAVVRVVGDRALGAVELEVHARFGPRVVGWRLGPLWTEGTALDVPLTVPSSVGSDPLQVTWPTSVTVHARTDAGPRIVVGAIAWTGGLAAAPRVVAAAGTAPVDAVLAAHRAAAAEEGEVLLHEDAAPPVTWDAAPASGFTANGEADR